MCLHDTIGLLCSRASLTQASEVLARFRRLFMQGNQQLAGVLEVGDGGHLGTSWNE